MRLLLALCCLLTNLNLTANDDLYARLRTLLPGDGQAVATERQFLYRQLNDLFTELEAEERVHRKGKKKRIKRIQEHLHERYFRSYRTDADLLDAFRSNSFNDATAAILAALCLEKYKVAYAFRVDHYRAFVVADPGRRDVRYDFAEDRRMRGAEKQAFRRDYLTALRSTIVPELTDSLSEAYFYANYYRPETPLTVPQMAGFMYYTAAQHAYRASNYTVAVGLTERALTYENRTPFLVLLKAADTQLNTTDEPILDGDVTTLYSQWSEAPDNAYLPAAILQKFDEEQRTVLAGGDPKSTGKLLKNYLAGAPHGSAEWREDMELLQRLRLLHHYYKSDQFQAARAVAEDLHYAAPDEERLEFLLGEVIVAQLRRKPLAGAAFRKRMGELTERYPFLRTHERFVDLYLREQAVSIRNHYYADRPDLARPALDHFRASLSSLTISEERSLWTLTAFTAASYHAFLAGDYAAALRFVDEGLGYAPDDQFLLHRRAVLANY